MLRRFFVWLHRWIGLAIAAFLMIEGLTGSLIAFYSDLDHFINPQLFAKSPSPDVSKLDFAALAARAEILEPHGRVQVVAFSDPERANVNMLPRQDPVTDKPYELGFSQIFLNPWTGEELGRTGNGDISEGWVSLMPFIFKLHENLALGMLGSWVFGIVALVWTLDCFIGFYLTLPVTLANFFHRWKPSWLIKWPAGAFRLNFDLHRANGLWLWPILFIFAWSSVMLTCPLPAYEWVTRALFDFPSQGDQDLLQANSTPPHPVDLPRLDWRAAQVVGGRLMAEQAASHGFVVKQSVGLAYEPNFDLYTYFAQTSRDVREHTATTVLMFDGHTGAFRSLVLATGEHSGNTVSSWLWALHFGDVFGLPYRIFVCALGLVITMLCITGVYIWWKKRCARMNSRRGPAGRGPARVRRSWRSVASVAWSSAAAKGTQQSRRVRH